MRAHAASVRAPPRLRMEELLMRTYARCITHLPSREAKLN